MPLAVADNVTFTTTGALNQGTIQVKDYYTGSTTLSKSNASAVAKGFTLVGNPYACSIDWDLFTANTAIVTANISNTIYIYNTVLKTYSTYAAGGSGIGTNMPTSSVHNANIIPSGQGFFVQAIGAGSSTMSFTEAAKTVTNAQQASTTNLLLASTPTSAVTATSPEYLRVQLYKDSVNNEDALLFFNPSSATAYIVNEDSPYLKAGSAVNFSTMSADNVALAINKFPFPTKTKVVNLNVAATTDGAYQIKLTELGNVPNLFDIWLKDAYNKDSVDIKHNPVYNFTITNSDTLSTSAKRLTLVFRQNPAYAYNLLTFTGAKATGGVQLNWTTANEDIYTSFTLERSVDGGKTFTALTTIQSNATGGYSYLDTNPAPGQDQYRLKTIDLDGGVTYSTIVIITYAGSTTAPANGSTVSVYPNPAKDVVNLTVTSATNTTGSTFTINIMTSNGTLVRSFTSNQTAWQGNTSDLLAGLYVIRVIRNEDKVVMGTTKFVKL